MQTDGRGLKPELLQLGRVFTESYDRPAIFCSSSFVLLYFHSGHDEGQWSKSYQPPVARVLMINLGNRETKGVKMQLQDRQKGVWAAGPVDIPARSVVSGAVTHTTGQRFLGLRLGRNLHHGSRCTGIRGVQLPGLPPSTRSRVWSRSCMVKRLLGKWSDYAFTNLSIGTR